MSAEGFTYQLNDCLNAIGQNQQQIQALEDKQKAENIRLREEMECCRESIAEYTRQQMLQTEQEMIRMAKLLVILTENSLIEQGFAQTEHLNNTSVKFTAQEELSQKNDTELGTLARIKRSHSKNRLSQGDLS